MEAFARPAGQGLSDAVAKNVRFQGKQAGLCRGEAAFGTAVHQ